MDDKERLSLSIYSIVNSIKDTLSLPSHDILEKTLYYSLGLLCCSVMSKLLGFYTFIEWPGALLCTALLILLLWLERSENDALLRMYSNARLSARKIARKGKSASAYLSARRPNNGHKRSQGKAGKRNKSNAKSKAGRHSVMLHNSKGKT